QGQKPVSRILEARMAPPYEGPLGVGLDTFPDSTMNNVPSLPRLQSATFRGAFPFAWIDFSDDNLPVRVSLEAFNPLVPLDADASGLPVAILRYSIKNPNPVPAKVSVAFSMENPVGKQLGINSPLNNVYREEEQPNSEAIQGGRCVYREEGHVNGLYMDN